MTDPPREHWTWIRDLFDEAVELPEPARAAFLDTACPDATIRAEVDTLLRADLDASLLDRPAADGAHDLVAEVIDSQDRALPGQIGAWRPVRELGRGGQGAVYLAERADGAFQQTAALKRLDAGPSTRRAGLERRFAQERQILARLDDPGIARLLDGGVADDGAPYLVMEWVHGVPITTWADARGLDVRARVKLFVQVCDAVGYAHRHLVVHRDLKPSNVFVTDGDAPTGERSGGSTSGDGSTAPVQRAALGGSTPPAQSTSPAGSTPSAGSTRAVDRAAGRVKLLDFGIARLLGDADVAPAALTGTGLPLLTPEYAAPEQVRGGAITTATDVYALGVLLYELLAGQRPTEITDRTLAGIVRAVCDETPPAPSAVAPDARRRALSGDLDTIVCHALGKEPEQRYRSADALGDELQRWLGGLPIEARAPTARYRAGRFVKRNRTVVATAAVAALVLLAATAVYVVSLSAEQRRASRAADRAEQTSAFLVSLFGDADPAAVQGDTLTALDLLDRGVRRIDGELADQPDLQADLYGVVSGAYGSLGRPDLAVRFARRALTLLAGGVDPAGRVTAQVRLAEALGVARDAGADSLYQDAVRRARGLDDPEPLLSALYGWGMSTFDNRTGPQRATEILDEAITAHRAHHGDADPHVALLSVRLASVVPDLGDYERAIRLLREALPRLPADAFPRERASALMELGDVLYYSNEKEEAARLFREALEIRTRLYGDDHLSLAGPLKSLATTHIGTDGEAANRMLQRALSIIERVPDPDGATQVDLANILSTLQNLYGNMGDHESALAYARRALAVVEQFAEPLSPVMVQHVQLVAVALSKAGRDADARAAWDRSLALTPRVFGDASAVTLMNQLRAGWAAHEAGDAARADRLIARADAQAMASLPSSSHTRAEIAYRLGRSRLEAGRADDALEPLRRAVAAKEVLGRVGVDHYPEATSLGNMAQATLGRALLATGRFESAERNLAAAAGPLADSLGAGHEEALAARDALSRVRRRR